MNERSMAAPDDDLLGAVVESFLDRFRHGERPSLTELMAQHPQLAGQFRELMPALIELEQHGELGDDLKSPPTNRRNFSGSSRKALGPSNWETISLSGASAAAAWGLCTRPNTSL